MPDPTVTFVTFCDLSFYLMRVSLDVDSDRAEHVHHAEPAPVRTDSLRAKGRGTNATASEAEMAMTGILMTDRSGTFTSAGWSLDPRCV